MRPAVAPTTSPVATAAWYGIGVGLSSPRGLDGRCVRVVTGSALPLDAARAAAWFDACLPLVLAESRDAAQAAADAYAITWAVRYPSDRTETSAPPAAVERAAPRGRRVTFVPAQSPPRSEERPMATKTASAPKKSKPAAKAKPPAVAVAVDPHVELADLRAQLAKAEASLESTSKWDDQYVAAEAKTAELRARVAALEVQTLPMPAEMSLAFREGETPIGIIALTGNHREHVDDAQVRQLARSIQIHGLQQRIGVRDAGDSYELIYGSRRLAAAKLAGLAQIPTKIYASDLTPAQVEILRTIENFGRQELTHAERAIAVARTIDAIERTLAMPQLDAFDSPSFILKIEIEKAGGLHAYVGQQLGYPTKWVQDHAYVAQLGGEARALLGAGRITIGHARELAKLGDKKIADQIAGYSARDENGTGGRDVAWTRRQVVEHLRSLRGVGWELDTAFGEDVPGCTGYACKACRFNSKSDPDLFGGAIADEPEAGVCTNEACFKAKTEIVEKALTKLVVKAKPKVETGKLEATENGIRELVPRFVRASTAARRVKRETTVAEPAKTDAPASPARPAKATSEEVAQRKLNDALVVRGRAVEEAIKVAVDADATGKRIMAMALLQFVEFDGFGNFYSDDEVSNDDAKLLRLAADPDRLQEFAAAAIKADQWAGHTFEDFNWTPAIQQIFVDAWALKVPPAPTLADFLPKPKAEKPTARAAKADAAPAVIVDKDGNDVEIEDAREQADYDATIGDAVRRATHHVAGAADRWAPLQAAGATDAQIRERLSDELGSNGGCGGNGIRVEFKGGTSPVIHVKSPRVLKLTGRALVEMVRDVLAIPPGPEARQIEKFVSTFPPKADPAVDAFEPGPDAVKLGGDRLSQSSHWRTIVESIDDWPDLDADALEAASRLVRISPANPRDDAPLIERTRPSTVGPILKAGGVEFAVTFSRHELDRVVYELHPLTSGTLAVYEDWLAIREKHPKCAPEEIPLAGLRVQTSSGFARTIANDNALLVEVPIDRAAKPAPADDFAEDARIYQADELGLTLAEIEDANCLETLVNAGRKGVGDVPAVKLLTISDGTQFASVGGWIIRGRHVHRLLCVATTAKNKSVPEASYLTYRGTSAGERAANNVFDGAIVEAEKKWWILVERPDLASGSPIYVAVDAPPRGKSSPSTKASGEPCALSTSTTSPRAGG